MENKKKILYVITQGAWGGAQRYVFDMATNLGSDFDVMLAVGEPRGSHDLQNKLSQYPNIKIFQLKHLVRPLSFIKDLLSIFELAGLYRQIRPNIIHLNSTKAGVIGSLAQFINNLAIWQFGNSNIIYTVHGWVFNEPLSKLTKEIYFWAEKITARWKNKIIVLSKEDEVAASNELGLGREKIALIPLGVAKENFLEKTVAKEFIEKKAGLELNDSKIFGTIANFFKTKGLDILIEAVSQIKNDINNDVKFVIIGDGPEKNNLVIEIKKYGLEDVVLLLGHIEDAAKYLLAFDVFVSPSRKEGLPYTLLEAQQVKLPIIATAVGGVPSLVKNGYNGIVVPPDDFSSLANAMLYGLKHTEEMRIMAKKTTEFHDLSRMLNKTEDLYD